MAGAIFYARGYDGTSLAAIASKLDVTDKALYHYFKSKDNLYLETINVCMDWVSAVIESIDRSGEPGLDKIKNFARLTIRGSGKTCPCPRWLPDHLGNTVLGRRFRRLEREHEEALIGWVEEGIADGSIRPADPRMLWRWNQGALIWIDAWARSDDPPYDAAHLEAEATAMLDRCLGNFSGH